MKAPFICFAAAAVLAIATGASNEDRQEVWTFDRLDKIGGHSTTVLGHPRVISSPLGKAVQFNGAGDALFIDKHPLSGVEKFTFEVVFRPERGGAEEQRWFHLSELDPKTGADTENRYLFEIRVIGEQWALESLVRSSTGGKGLIDRKLLHPLDVWSHVAMVYDGSEFRSYVNGALQAKGEGHFSPMGPGHASVGVRINKVYYFKGSVRQARFTRRALAPEEFLKLPAKLRQ
jgi:hypothetical protein